LLGLNFQELRHVFRSACNVEKTFVVAPLEVSGMEPALVVKSGRRRGERDLTFVST